MLGSSKDRIGTLTIQHGQVEARRYEGGQSILVYQFSAMTGTLSDSAPTSSSCITIHPAVDASEKARTFTFKSQKDRTQFEEAFQATKAWIQPTDACLRDLPTRQQRGAVSAIVEGMRLHAADARVQERGCAALRDLADKNDANKENIAALGGIEAIIQAMSAHLEFAAVQQAACWALINLAAQNDANKAKIKKAGGEEKAKRAMAAPNATGETKIWGQRLLNVLTQ